MIWKDIAHYAVSALLIADGLAGMLGVPLPGVTVSDPKAAFVTGLMGLGVFVSGLKGGWRSSK